MNQRLVDKILHNLLSQLIGKREFLKNLHQATKLSKTTLRNIKSRKGLTADSLIKLLLAHGVSEDLLTNLPRSKPSKISKTLTEWNKIGVSLTDEEREKIGRFVKTVKSEWRIR